MREQTMLEQEKEQQRERQREESERNKYPTLQDLVEAHQSGEVIVLQLWRFLFGHLFHCDCYCLLFSSVCGSYTGSWRSFAENTEIYFRSQVILWVKCRLT